jgi:hypothetical protein
MHYKFDRKIDALAQVFEQTRSFYASEAIEQDDALAIDLAKYVSADVGLPTLKDIIAHHLRGTRFGIRMDNDGLLAAGDRGAHHVAHATGSILPLGDASNGDVAIGDNPNQALVGPRLDHRNDSDVLPTHHLGGFAHGRVGCHATRVFGHNVLDFHMQSPSSGRGNKHSPSNGQAACPRRCFTMPTGNV